MNKISTLIVEDEAPARQYVRQILQQRFPNEIEIVGEAADLTTARKKIKSCQPELVLMDIQLPPFTAFDLLQDLRHINFRIVFITAYEEYALRAIRFHAIDYVLKPLTPEPLVRGIRRAIESWEMQDAAEKYKNLKKYNENPGSLDNIVAIPRPYLIPTRVKVKHIVYCKAKHYQCLVFLSNGDIITSSKPLRHFKDILADYHFAEVSRSYMVHLTYVKRFEQPPTDRIWLTYKEQELRLARSKKKDFWRDYLKYWDSGAEGYRKKR